VAIPLDWFYKVSFPFIWILNHAANWLLRRIGIEPVTEGGSAHSEDELRLILGAAQKSAGGPALRRELVLNALDLRQRIVRDVMRPRQEMVVLNTESSMAECLEIAENSRYSRFPLTEGGDLDKTLGLVHSKDLYAMRIKARSGAGLLPVARKLIYVPETARLENLLQRFLERKSHFAIVVDEYGGTMGMVTLENILEELVGQIQDEFDQEKPLLIRRSETEWEMSGALPMHELEEFVGETLDEEGITTVSGWVTQRLGGFPKTGDTLTVGPFEMRVEEMDETRVARLKIVKHEKPESDEESEEGLVKD
jgi:CBS domain containing-hemolysin-like protein